MSPLARCVSSSTTSIFFFFVIVVYPSARSGPATGLARQRYGEAGATAPAGAFHIEPPLVILDDFPGNKQAEPGALYILRIDVLRPVELLEYFLLILFLDADALVDEMDLAVLFNVLYLNDQS